MTDRRVGKLAAASRLGRIFTYLAMYMIEPFGLAIIRLQLIIRNRPGRRDSTVMFYLAKIFFAESEKRRAIEFSIAAHVVIGVRMKLATIGVPPKLFGIVAAPRIHFQGVPVFFFARNKWTALEQ